MGTEPRAGGQKSSRGDILEDPAAVWGRSLPGTQSSKQSVLTLGNEPQLVPGKARKAMWQDGARTRRRSQVRARQAFCTLPRSWQSRVPGRLGAGWDGSDLHSKAHCMQARGGAPTAGRKHRSSRPCGGREPSSTWKVSSENEMPSRHWAVRSRRYVGRPHVGEQGLSKCSCRTEKS